MHCATERAFCTTWTEKWKLWNDSLLHVSISSFSYRLQWNWRHSASPEEQEWSWKKQKQGRSYQNNCLDFLIIMELLLHKTVTILQWSCTWGEKTLKRAMSQVQKSCKNSKQRLRLAAATTCHQLKEVWDWPWQAHMTWQTMQPLTLNGLNARTDQITALSELRKCPQWHCFPKTFFCGKISRISEISASCSDGRVQAWRINLLQWWDP